MSPAGALHDHDVGIAQVVGQLALEGTVDEKVVAGHQLQKGHRHKGHLSETARVCPVGPRILVADPVGKGVVGIVATKGGRHRLVVIGQTPGRQRVANAVAVLLRLAHAPDGGEDPEQAALGARGNERRVQGIHVGRVHAHGVAHGDAARHAVRQRPAAPLFAQVLGHEVGPERVADQKELARLQTPGELLHDAAQIARVAAIVRPGRPQGHAAAATKIKAGRDPAAVRAGPHHALDVAKAGVVVNAVQNQDDGLVDGTVENLLFALFVGEVGGAAAACSG